MFCSGLSGAGKGCSFGSSVLEELSEAHAPCLGTAFSRQTLDKAIPSGKVLLGGWRQEPEEAQAAGLCRVAVPSRRPAEGLCPAPPWRLPVLGPARCCEGPVTAAGPGRPSSLSRRPGDTGAHRAGIELPSPPSAGSRAPFYITGGSAAVTQRTAGLPRPGRGTGGREGRGPRLSPSAGLAPPPWRPLPRGHLRYLRRVRHPGAAGGQLPFPPCLPPCLPPCAPPPPPHRPLTIAALGAAGERPASRSRRWAPSLFFFFLSLPPFPRVYPPDLEVNVASAGREPASLKGAAPAQVRLCWVSGASTSAFKARSVDRRGH